MLVNLIDNSIKYTPSGGAITMSLERHGDKLRMVFSDNGPGIPPEKYTKVFQRFYRVDESRGIQPGNGLGLSLVQAVVELHGGEVWLSDGREFHPGSKTPGLQVNITMPVQA
jgi:signal transduction histidine kinase